MAGDIRLAHASDAAQMPAIYAPLVRETAISFELVSPTPPEFRGRIERALHQWPWLVYKSEGGVLGYAYAGRFRERDAYQWPRRSPSMSV